MSSATITNANEGEALQFPWGAIKWLCNDQIDPDAEMTFGLVYLNRRRGQPTPLPPKLRGTDLRPFGQMRPPTRRRSYPADRRNDAANPTRRTPQRCQHRLAACHDDHLLFYRGSANHLRRGRIA